MTRDAPLKPAKTADAVAGHLEMLILEGALHPGERLLSERELAEKLAVSRPTLRDALRKLEDKRLLTIRREGTFVAEGVGASFSDPLVQLLAGNPDTTFDYLEFRCVVEGSAAALAAQRATEIDRAVLRQVFERMEASHAKDDFTEEAAADTDLHLAIYEATHNRVLLHIMRGLADLLRQGVFYSRDKLYGRRGVRDLLLDQHRAIYQAVMAGDADAARSAAERHIYFIHTAIRDIRDAEARLEASLRRIGRSDLVASPGRRSLGAAE